MDLDIRKDSQRFWVGDDPEAPLAVIDFVRDDRGRLVVDHTEVSETLRGQGIARRLVDAVAALARAEGRRIVPVCPYAKKVLEGDPQYADVIDLEE